jgi:hypothetical protein
MISKNISLITVQKIGILAVALASSIACLSPVVAQASSSSGKVLRTETRQDQTMNKLKTRADAEISRRVTALTALIGRINNFKRISADQKTKFATEIQTEISTLTQLKAKIHADTDITTLRTDVQSIVTSFRVYAVYIPSTRIVANADVVLDIAGQMQQATQKLQDAINSVQSAGRNISSTTALMTDRNAKITDAITQANNAISTVSALTPAGYPGNQTQLKSARDMLAVARKDLRTAQQDAIKVRQILKTLGGVTPSILPSPTP